MAYHKEYISSRSIIKASWGNKIESVLERLGSFMGVTTSDNLTPTPEIGDWHILLDTLKIAVFTESGWQYVKGELGSVPWDKVDKSESKLSDIEDVPEYVAGTFLGVDAFGKLAWMNLEESGRIRLTGSDELGYLAAKLDATLHISGGKLGVNVSALEDSFYTKIQLQTPGQAQVHWDNITNAPVFATQDHTHTKSDITDFNEGDYVHTSGDETISGTKTFENIEANTVKITSTSIELNTSAVDPTTVPFTGVFLHLPQGAAATLFYDGRFWNVTTPGEQNGPIATYGYVNEQITSHTHTKSQITDFYDADYVHTSGDEEIGGNKTFSGDVTVLGSLTVEGNLTYVESTDLVVKDNTITLNAGETAAGVSKGTAGIEIDRGTLEKARFVFDETDDTFKVGLGNALSAISLEGHTHTTSDITDFTSALEGFLSSKTTDDLAEGSTNLYFTQDRAKDAVASSLAETQSIRPSYDGTFKWELKYNTTGAATQLLLNDSGLKVNVLVDNNTIRVNEANQLEVAGGTVDSFHIKNLQADTLVVGGPDADPTLTNGKSGVLFYAAAGNPFLFYESDELRFRKSDNSIETLAFKSYVDDTVQNAIDTHTHTKSDITDFVETDYVHTSGDEEIAGNKTFTGTVEAAQIQLKTRNLYINTAESGEGVAGGSGTAGLYVKRGTLPDAYLIFDEADDTWKVSSGSTAIPISLEGHTHTASDITDLSAAFDSFFSSKTTDDLAEGSANLYFTQQRARDAIATALQDTQTIQVSYDGSFKWNLKHTDGTATQLATTDSGIKVDVLVDNTTIRVNDSNQLEVISFTANTVDVDYVYTDNLKVGGANADLTLTDGKSGILFDSAVGNPFLFYDADELKFRKSDNSVETLAFKSYVDDVIASHTHTKSDITDFAESDYVHTTGDETIYGNKTFANDVTVQGNLTVQGNVTYVNSTDLQVSDNTIVLNAGESGAGVTKGVAGIEIDRGTLENAKFIFDEADDTFKVGVGASLQRIALEGHTHTAAEITDLSSAFDSFFASKTTDDLTEGSTNLYFTQDRAREAVASSMAESQTIQPNYNTGTFTWEVKLAQGDATQATATDYGLRIDVLVDNTTIRINEFNQLEVINASWPNNVDVDYVAADTLKVGGPNADPTLTGGKPGVLFEVTSGKPPMLYFEEAENTLKLRTGENDTELHVNIATEPWVNDRIANHAHTKSDITDFVESDYVHTAGDETVTGIKTFEKLVSLDPFIEIASTERAGLRISNGFVLFSDPVSNEWKVTTPTKQYYVGVPEIDGQPGTRLLYANESTTREWSSPLTEHRPIYVADGQPTANSPMYLSEMGIGVHTQPDPTADVLINGTLRAQIDLKTTPPYEGNMGVVPGLATLLIGNGHFWMPSDMYRFWGLFKARNRNQTMLFRSFIYPNGGRWWNLVSGAQGEVRTMYRGLGTLENLYVSQVQFDDFETPEAFEYINGFVIFQVPDGFGTKINLLFIAPNISDTANGILLYFDMWFERVGIRLYSSSGTVIADFGPRISVSPGMWLFSMFSVGPQYSIIRVITSDNVDRTDEESVAREPLAAAYQHGLGYGSYAALFVAYAGAAVFLSQNMIDFEGLRGLANYYLTNLRA